MNSNFVYLLFGAVVLWLYVISIRGIITKKLPGTSGGWRAGYPPLKGNIARYLSIFFLLVAIFFSVYLWLTKPF